MGKAVTVHPRRLAKTGNKQSGFTLKPAGEHTSAVSEGNFVPDPVIARLADRAAHPIEAPSWKAFRHYVSARPDIAEWRQRGFKAMMESHQGLRLGVAALAASLVLLLVALLAYWWIMPATADADSPYVSVDGSSYTSTPVDQWEKGVVPSLYQNDEAWADVPFGQGTLAGTGAAPVAFAMAYIAVTGDTGLTPADFAAWGSDHDLTAAGTDTIATYLERASDHYGIHLIPLGLESQSLRHAIVSGTPVIVITQPGTFSPAASVVVLDDIDKDSHIVLHDPTSATRSAKGWEFSDIIQAGALAFEVRAA